MEDKISENELIMEQEQSKQEHFKQNNISYLFIALILLAVAVVGIAYMWNTDGGDENSHQVSNGASKVYIEHCTEEFIGQYLAYPHTIEIESIEYACKKYDELGYEMWQTKGYFSAENKFGMRINDSFFVQIKFVYEKGMAYKYIVQIDGEDKYRSIEETYD